MSLISVGTYPGESVFPGDGRIYPDDDTSTSIKPTVTPTADELYAQLTPIAGDDADTGWVLLSLCDAVVSGSWDNVLQLSRDSDVGPGWSALLDLARCPDGDLPWLAQFVGAIAPVSNTPDQNRDLILNRPAWARGRPATLIDHVQQTLTGSQHCTLLERDSSPYHATIQVYSTEMPDEAATLAAIAANKPGPMIVALDVLSAPSYADVLATLPGSPTYGDRESAYPTYGDIQALI